jgi:hypothetical protein
MSMRADLHALLDRLPEDALPVAAHYLSAVEAGVPPADLEEDEELGPAEQAIIDASRAALARGEVVSHTDLLARRATRSGAN